MMFDSYLDNHVFLNEWSGIRSPVASRRGITDEQGIQDTSVFMSRRDNMFVDTNSKLPRPVGTECLLRKINRMRKKDSDTQ
jgi:hypothetical protein